MVCFRNVVCAALVALSTQAIAYSPVANCGWTGCKYEPGLLHQDDSTSTVLAPKPEDVAALIDKLTVKSQALQAPAASLTIVNGPLVIAGLGPFPQIISGFVDIVATATSGLANAQDMSPLEDARQADLVFDAFEAFVRVHQQLLSILIGKSGLFVTVPFVGAPVAAALRQIEAVVDTLAFLLIDIARSRATDIQALAASLGTTIDRAITSYSGI